VRKFSFFSARPVRHALRPRNLLGGSRGLRIPFALAQIAALGNGSRAFTTRPGASPISILSSRPGSTWAYAHTFHSDLRSFDLVNTARDITTTPSEALRDRFDVVLNISTLEKFAADHVAGAQASPGAAAARRAVIGTFDFPGCSSKNVEDFVNGEGGYAAARLSPRNSRLEDRKLWPG